ncbi:MAG: hypothetical protein NW226_22505 [Microscillaceae bacterium]|nr:hypothetical protein [Microscillaceae bacterium]
MIELNNNVATHLYKPKFDNYQRNPLKANKSNTWTNYISNFDSNTTNYLTSNTSVGIQPTIQDDFQTLEIEHDLRSLHMYLKLKPKYSFKIKGKIVSVTKKKLKIYPIEEDLL